jgi:hypothetical protein
MKTEPKKVDWIANVLRKGYEILKQEKEILNRFRLFFCFKILYSFLRFDFVGVINCFIGIVKFRNEVVKRFITLTKTMKILRPSAMGQ